MEVEIKAYISQVQKENKVKNDDTNFYFCLLYCLYHVAIIICQVKKASTFSRG